MKTREIVGGIIVIILLLFVWFVTKDYYANKDKAALVAAHVKDSTDMATIQGLRIQIDSLNIKLSNCENGKVVVRTTKKNTTPVVNHGNNGNRNQGNGNRGNGNRNHNQGNGNQNANIGNNAGNGNQNAKKAEPKHCSPVYRGDHGITGNASGNVIYYISKNTLFAGQGKPNDGITFLLNGRESNQQFVFDATINYYVCVTDDIVCGDEEFREWCVFIGINKSYGYSMFVPHEIVKVQPSYSDGTNVKPNNVNGGYCFVSQIIYNEIQ